MSHHTSDTVLKLSVLGGVDERVDAAVAVHQYDAEVVEQVVAINVVPDESEKVHDLVC